MADRGDAAAATPVVVMSPLGEVSPRKAPGTQGSWRLEENKHAHFSSISNFAIPIHLQLRHPPLVVPICLS